MKIHSKLRQDDVMCSNVVTNFLIKNFYEKLCRKYEIILDKEQQVQGIDSYFELNGKFYSCDEKSAIRYVNKNLQTFSLELSFLNKQGKLTSGWLLNEKNINNSYLFIWIDKAKVNAKNLITNVDDIQQIEIALVTKDKIINYLDSLGWSIDKLLKKSQLILNNENETLFSEKYPEVRFCFSKQLVEKPVNILIQRKKLIEISDFNFIFNNETSNTSAN